MQIFFKNLSSFHRKTWIFGGLNSPFFVKTDPKFIFSPVNQPVYALPHNLFISFY